tara:strand:- start:204 stop:860 length:657 start_codon:yes stop_codon:yes gene_type:complete
MRKLITAVTLSCLIGFSALAEGMIGIKFSNANMEASGSHTTNSTTSGSLGSGGAAVSASDDADFNMASFFIERSIDAGPLNMSVGLDIIPMSADVDKLDGGDGFDATVTVENVITAYVQPTFGNFFVKAGYTMGDVDITDVSRQATTAGTASTDGDQSKDLEGFMYGAGIQFDLNAGIVRLEGTFTDFDEISHTNSNGKVVKADAEMTLISLSLGRSF